MKKLIFVLSVALLPNSIAVAGSGAAQRLAAEASSAGKGKFATVFDKAKRVGTNLLPAGVAFATSKIIFDKVGRAGTNLLLSTVLVCGMTACDQGMKITKDIINGGGSDTMMSEEIVKIGVVYEKELFPQTLQGVELAAAQINSMSGVNGARIVLFPKDNQRSGSVSYDVTEKLILEDNVHAFIGPNFSTLAEVVDELAQRYSVPMVAIGATNPGVTAAGDMVFLTAFTDSFQGLVMARHAVEELGADTAAVLYYDSDVYSEGLADTFTASFGSMGGDVVVSVAYPPYNDDSDYENFAAQLSERIGEVVAAQPDVIFIPGFVPDAPAAAKLLKEAGITATFLGADGWGAGPLVEISGDALEGAFFSDHFTADGDGLGESTIKFIDDFMREYGEKPDALSALGYDALRIVAQAAERTGEGLSRETIRDEIEATMNYMGATNIARYNEDRHPVKSAVIKVIRNGEIKFYKIINP